MKQIDLLPANPRVVPMRILSEHRQEMCTQAQLGERMGASPQRVSYLEGFEDITVMRIMTLQQYVEALGGRLVISVELPERGAGRGRA